MHPDCGWETYRKIFSERKQLAFNFLDMCCSVQLVSKVCSQHFVDVLLVWDYYIRIFRDFKKGVGLIYYLHISNKLNWHKSNWADLWNKKLKFSETIIRIYQRGMYLKTIILNIYKIY